MKMLRSVTLALFALVALLSPVAALAYTATITPHVTSVNGRTCTYYNVAETSARDTSEFSITGVPVIGTIWIYHADRTAGTGLTINPIVCRAVGCVTATIDHVGTALTTGDYVLEEDPTGYISPAGTLFIRSRPSSVVTDHSITSEILICPGLP